MFGAGSRYNFHATRATEALREVGSRGVGQICALATCGVQLVGRVWDNAAMISPKTRHVAGVVALLTLACCSDDGGNGPGPDGSVPDGPSAIDQRVTGEQTPTDGPARDSAPTEAGTTTGDGGPSCTVFPASNPWNTDISGSKVHASSAAFIASIGATKGLHPDFGTVWNGAPNGIPYVVVPGNQAKVPIVFTDYGNESDPGPYPIPPNAPIEGGANGTGDRHVIAVDMTGCVLYELFNAWPQPNGSWEASSGATFDMRSNNLRPIGWTSADAAGLPVYPGLVRRDEVKAGAINHALRFTVSKSQKAYVLPATHYASSSTDPNLPPMGLRLRLKASFDISGFSADNQVILTAMKKYGMFVADNGSDWFISGAPDPSWDDDDLAKLSQVKGSDFEAVDTGPIKTSY
jgi:hypothetical protein